MLNTYPPFTADIHRHLEVTTVHGGTNATPELQGSLTSAMDVPLREGHDKYIPNHESTSVCFHSPGDQETTANDGGTSNNDIKGIPMNESQGDKIFSDNFLYKSNNCVTMEGVVNSELDKADNINSANMNFSIYGEIGAEASLVNRMAQINCFPRKEQQSFENPCTAEHSNICMSDNGISRALFSTDKFIDDYSAVVNWLSFGAKSIRDVTAMPMRPSEAHTECYKIKDIYNNKSDDSYPGLIGTFEYSQEQALDLSCRKSNVNINNNQSRDAQIKSDSIHFCNEDTRSNQPRDCSAPARSKYADENVSPNSIQLPSTAAPCGTIPTTLSDSRDQRNFPTEQSTRNHASKVYKPIPKYPHSIYSPMSFDPFQCGVLGHQLASVPYGFPANYRYPTSFYSLQAQSQLPINLNDPNKADGMWNSVYDKAPTYNLSSDYNRFDNKFMTYFPPSAFCSTIDANLAKMSHLLPFPASAPLHPPQQIQLNYLSRELPHQHVNENTAFQSRQSNWFSGYGEPSESNRDSSQSLTTTSPFDFSHASSQIPQPIQQMPPHKLNSSKISTYEQPDIRVNFPLKNHTRHSETIRRSSKTDQECTKPQPNQIVLPPVIEECNANTQHPKRPQLFNSIAFSMSTNKNESHSAKIASNSSQVRRNAELIEPKSVSSTHCTESTCIESNRQSKERRTSTHTKSDKFKWTKESTKEINSDRILKRKWKKDNTDNNEKVIIENTQLTFVDKTCGNNLFSADKNHNNAKRIFTVKTQEKVKSFLGVPHVQPVSNANTVSDNHCTRNEKHNKNIPMVCGVNMRRILQQLGNGQSNNIKGKVQYTNDDKEKHSSFECKEYIGNHKLSNSSTNPGNDNKEARAEQVRCDLKLAQASDITNIERAKSDNCANQYCRTELCEHTNCDPTKNQILLPQKLSTNRISTSAGSNVAKSFKSNTVLQNVFSHPISQASKSLIYTSKSHQTQEANKGDPSIHVKENQLTKTSKIVDSDLILRQHILSDETCSTSVQSEVPTNTIASTKTNIETLISVDRNNARPICCTTYKTRSVEDKAKSKEINSNITSLFKCKECDSNHHTFSALLQHQSIGCELRSQSGAAPVHATDCVGNYMRHDAKWVGEKCQCTPCPICKGIFGSKFRVYTHLQRGCYKEKIMRYRPDMFRVGGLGFGNIPNSSEMCKFPCCSFKTAADKCGSDANEGKAFIKDFKPSPLQKSQIMYVPQPKSRISKLPAVENSSNHGRNKNDSKHVPQNKRHSSLAKTDNRFEPRITLVTQERGNVQNLHGIDASTQFSSVVDVEKHSANDTFNININENIKKENLTSVYVHGSSIFHPPSVSTNLHPTVNHPSVVSLKKFPHNVSNNTRKATTIGQKPDAPTLYSNKSEEAIGLYDVKAENIKSQLGLETNEHKNNVSA